MSCKNTNFEDSMMFKIVCNHFFELESPSKHGVIKDDAFLMFKGLIFEIQASLFKFQVQVSRSNNV